MCPRGDGGHLPVVQINDLIHGIEDAFGYVVHVDPASPHVKVINPDVDSLFQCRTRKYSLRGVSDPKLVSFRVW
jgi:hypothetical protein